MGLLGKLCHHDITGVQKVTPITNILNKRLHISGKHGACPERNNPGKSLHNSTKRQQIIRDRKFITVSSLGWVCQLGCKGKGVWSTDLCFHQWDQPQPSARKSQGPSRLLHNHTAMIQDSSRHPPLTWTGPRTRHPPLPSPQGLQWMTFKFPSREPWAAHSQKDWHLYALRP